MIGDGDTDLRARIAAYNADPRARIAATNAFYKRRWRRRLAIGCVVTVVTIGGLVLGAHACNEHGQRTCREAGGVVLPEGDGGWRCALPCEGRR